MRIANKKVFFFFISSIFSNWHKCRFTINGISYNCSEQAMMHLKAKMFKDDETAIKILRTNNPREQKRLGREVKNFDQKFWDEQKEELMFRILLEKFDQNKDFKDELLKYTDYEFVEASPYDRIWGIGLEEDNDLILDEDNWKGENLLGKAITKVCKILGNETSKEVL